MKIQAYSYYQGDLIDAKRIYLTNKFSFECTYPNCKEVIVYDNCVPFISYGSYCHCAYCKECGFESEDKLYTLNEIGADYVDVTFNKEYDIKFYGWGKEE